jgi:hypothetical protein
MKYLRKILLYILIFFVLPGAEANAQELYCNVQVTAQKIQGSNRQIFITMQKDIYDFMNNTVWTNMVVSYAERIECSILINLTDQLSADEFRGTIQVQLSRPVYNTTYNSTVLNFIDNNVQFRYVEFAPLEFDPNVYRNALTSILGYYAYLIIGFDSDTYSYSSGTPFFQIAEKIVNNAQNAPEPGWKPYDGSRNRNRYWLVKNILNSEYSGVRSFLYEYHILGLDKMESRVGEARIAILESLKNLQEVFRKRPDPYMYYLQLVIDAKREEMINIYAEAFPEEKGRVIQLLAEIDPANKAKYDKINTSQEP